MIQIRKSQERGLANHDWLHSQFTFSFADYHDPNFMGFRALRVINEDVIRPGQGFGTHPHQDMEILTFVLEGTLEHKDSMGNGSLIRPGEVQRMTAGTGVTHSEVNPSSTESVHLLQIWVFPEARGLTPGYEQKAFSEEERRGKLCLIAARHGQEGAVTIHQDVRVFASVLEAKQNIKYETPRGRFAWLQVTRGQMVLNGQAFQAGDGVAVEGPETLSLTAIDPSELLLFDLA